MTDNRLLRAERRALQREDEKFLDAPLNLGPDPRSIAAHTRHLAHLLANPASISPCGDAVLHISQVFSRTVPKKIGAQRADDLIACRKGCAYCCTQLVAATAPEALLVAATIRKRGAVVARVNDVNAQTKGLSMEARLQAKVSCPMLEDNACSVYAARPIGCRSFVSVNLDACIATFVNGADPQIPMPGEYLPILYTCRTALYAAMRLRNLKAASYELNAAVAAALVHDDAERRWLAGEDIFEGVPTTGDIPPAFEEAINRLVAFVAPTV